MLLQYIFHLSLQGKKVTRFCVYRCQFLLSVDCLWRTHPGGTWSLTRPTNPVTTYTLCLGERSSLNVGLPMFFWSHSFNSSIHNVSSISSHSFIFHWIPSRIGIQSDFRRDPSTVNSHLDLESFLVRIVFLVSPRVQDYTFTQTLHTPCFSSGSKDFTLCSTSFYFNFSIPSRSSFS